MTVDPRSPCIIGVSQAISRPADGPSPEPLLLWEEAVRSASDDSGARGDVLGAVDSLQVVYCHSWQYDDAAARLSDRLGITPAHRYYSGIGGTTSQVLVDQAAEAIVRGELDVGIVVGAEALDTARRLRKADERPQWSFKPAEKQPFPFEAPFHPAEIAHQVFQAYTTFALWDVARRAHLGVEPDAYRDSMGALFSPMTTIAAANPYSWFPTERSVRELVDPAPDNRMVAYPYTKYLISVMDVDLSGALIVASHEAADRLGVPVDKRVYVRGWCYGTDAVYVAEHEPTWASPAMAAASSEALSSAGVGIDDVAHIDLYSCFPSSVAFAVDALGLAPNDTRGFTVTGGLPYFGGAGSDYLTHSIATMVGILRADPGAFGLCSGVGMHMTKHVYGVYSTEPPSTAPRPDEQGVRQKLDARPRAQIVDTFDGDSTIVTYTVLHDRAGAPDWGLLVCDVEPGRRCYARVADPEMLAELEREECVGRRVRTKTNDGNVNEVTAWAS